ncbi:SGNH/GDSL hydrolase family protein [Longispora fulva]|uniref:Lysophospholipase L1-like esterase n=1 Tax=Longispora fulva TaxID=619741 RepID=A0A8J7KI15_9ACTN|nr:SGNH/GDSL hydrolase family protein [Longispora fulva]MBG6139260.1 lysophospholipase L1-like esterase [Longispora fulva]
MTERLVRFQHPEKTLGYLGGVDDERLAALYGLDVAAYQQLRTGLAERAQAAARDLLDDDEFAAKVDKLPFEPGQRIVAIGESTTDDLLSWFEILRHLLALRRPADDITCVNLAVSGHSSTQALTLLPALPHHAPDWILCMLGGNDAQRLGSPTGPTLVSLTETDRNLTALRDLAGHRTGARWVWLTPTLADEARVAAYPHFQRAGLTWANEDLTAIGDLLRQRPEPTVDTRTVTDPDRHLDDGLHLSLAGQRAVAATLVETLATL